VTGFQVQDDGMTTDTATTETVTTDPSTRGPLRHDDPRFTFAKAVTLAGEVIGAVRPDQLGDPTPCAAMDVRSLLGHLLEVLDRVAVIGRDENPFAAPPVPPAADNAWTEAWQETAHAVQSAWSDPAVLDRIVELPWSQVSGGETLDGYVSELTVHTWDLAVATGQHPSWDDEVVAAGFAAIRRILPDCDRAAMIAAAAQTMPPELRDFPAPFADAVPVAPDAPLIDRLVAWNGRNPALATGS